MHEESMAFHQNMYSLVVLKEKTISRQRLMRHITSYDLRRQKHSLYFTISPKMIHIVSGAGKSFVQLKSIAEQIQAMLH